MQSRLVVRSAILTSFGHYQVVICQSVQLRYNYTSCPRAKNHRSLWDQQRPFTDLLGVASKRGKHGEDLRKLINVTKTCHPLSRADIVKKYYYDTHDNNFAINNSFFDIWWRVVSLDLINIYSSSYFPKYDFDCCISAIIFCCKHKRVTDFLKSHLEEYVLSIGETSPYAFFANNSAASTAKQVIRALIEKVVPKHTCTHPLWTIPSRRVRTIFPPHEPHCGAIYVLTEVSRKAVVDSGKWKELEWASFFQN